jgi:23S rRNA pseudouridine2605 synthase
MPDRPPSGERIAKLLARAGVASRREVERMIDEGRVARGGVAIDTPATVLASLDGVTVDGQPVAAPEPARLFLFHKPAGVLTAERDPGGRRTIYDVLPRDLPRLVPVGRLDLNTEGLLLLTTDGELKRRLELPSTGVERAYRARAYGQVTQPQLEALIEGVEVEGVRYGSIDANIERRTGANVWIEMVLTEGKNREVRRVLEHLGLRVGRLIRTRYGPFILGEMPVGAIGEVRAADLAHFLRTLDTGRTGGTTLPAIRAGAAPPSARPAPRPRPTATPRTVRPVPKPRDAAPAPRPQPKPVAKPRVEEAEVEKPARPARPPQRKAGWAKPKPPSGPARRPRGPRKDPRR